MASSKLATRYAKSVMDIAIEQNKVENIFADMGLILRLMHNLEFAAIMRSPVVKSDKKQAILKGLLTGKVEPLTLLFLNLVTGKHREANIKEIADAFVEQYNQLKGIVPVTLTTAIPADNATLQMINDMLKSKAGLNNVQLTTQVKSSLVGGFTLNYQNKLLDASIRRQLQALSNSVKESIVA